MAAQHVYDYRDINTPQEITQFNFAVLRGISSVFNLKYSLELNLDVLIEEGLPLAYLCPESARLIKLGIRCTTVTVLSDSYLLKSKYADTPSLEELLVNPLTIDFDSPQIKPCKYMYSLESLIKAISITMHKSGELDFLVNSDRMHLIRPSKWNSNVHETTTVYGEIYRPKYIEIRPTQELKNIFHILVRVLSEYGSLYCA